MGAILNCEEKCNTHDVGSTTCIECMVQGLKLCLAILNVSDFDSKSYC